MANWCISSQFIPILCIHNIAGDKQGREHMNISRVKVVMNSNSIYTCFFFCSNSLLMYLYPAILSLWGCFHCLGQFVSFQPWTQTLPMHKGFTGNNAAGNPALLFVIWCLRCQHQQSPTSPTAAAAQHWTGGNTGWLLAWSHVTHAHIEWDNSHFRSRRSSEKT